MEVILPSRMCAKYYLPPKTLHISISISISILFVFTSHIIQKTFTMKIKFENMLSMRDVDAIKTHSV